MAIKDIAFVMYPVSDLKRSVAFYRDVMGFAPGHVAIDAWVEFDLGHSTFGIGNFEHVGKPGTAQSLAIEVDDLNDYRAALAKHGLASTEPHETPVCWISTVADPDGNKIYLHQAKA
jgi:predicted enzyme related to lactoylglutathione lyase